MDRKPTSICSRLSALHPVRRAIAGGIDSIETVATRVGIGDAFRVPRLFRERENGWPSAFGRLAKKT
ncbi:hypothetical protein X741_12925 [Mesorhizobium sp. LNHC229A00]|jgi:hypothetical protein|nr:hypothetical protein X741_12925 [Mesorhizobium sp. LNHC229A00]